MPERSGGWLSMNGKLEPGMCVYKLRPSVTGSCSKIEERICSSFSDWYQKPCSGSRVSIYIFTSIRIAWILMKIQTAKCCLQSWRRDNLLRCPQGDVFLTLHRGRQFYDRGPCIRHEHRNKGMAWSYCSRDGHEHRNDTFGPDYRSV